MALVSAATHAVVLGTRVNQLVVGGRTQCIGQVLKEARPARTTFVFVGCVEQGKVAGRTDVCARSLLRIQVACPGTLGAVLEQHVIGVGR